MYTNTSTFTSKSNLAISELLKETGRPSPTKCGSYTYEPMHKHTKVARNFDKTRIQIRRCPAIALSRWVIKLLPPHEATRCLEAAAVVGARYSGSQVHIPQTKIYHAAYHPIDNPYLYPYMFHCFFGSEEIFQRMWQFGTEANITAWTVIVRTAIHIGLDLPGAFSGCSMPTRTEPFSIREWVSLLHEGNIRPKYPELIPPEYMSEFFTRIEIQNSNSNLNSKIV